MIDRKRTLFVLPVDILISYIHGFVRKRCPNTRRVTLAFCRMATTEIFSTVVQDQVVFSPCVECLRNIQYCGAGSGCVQFVSKTENNGLDREKANIFYYCV